MGRHPILWLGLACWPVWVWAGQRLLASPEERWHLVPALLLAWAVWRRRGDLGSGAVAPSSLPSPDRSSVPWLAVALLAVYGITFPWTPPLLRALWVSCVLAALISRRFWGRTVVPGVWGSVLLALPMLPSLHFFFGYPWRRWTTLAAAQLLRLGGLGVTAEGAQLAWPGGVVAVDAPCSGLDMGWVVGVLLVALWLFVGTGWRRSLITAGATLGLVLVANALRASALFYVESGLLEASPIVARPWHHGAIGLAVFVPLCLLPGWFLIRPGTAPGGSSPAALSSSPGADPAPTPALARLQNQHSWLWGLALTVAFGLPWLGTRAGLGGPSASAADGFPGWPQHFEGKALVQLPLTPREERFGEGFPGHLGRFHDGRREILLRWVAAPTRRLHPADQCLRGHGYEVEYQPSERDAEGRPWTVLMAHDATVSLRLHEAIRDADGQQWSDVSAWYWAAVLGHSRGPWWSIVVAEGQ